MFHLGGASMAVVAERPSMAAAASEKATMYAGDHHSLVSEVEEHCFCDQDATGLWGPVAGLCEVCVRTGLVDCAWSSSPLLC